VDGPVVGTGDRVQAWVNRFGQPTKTILTGTGATTTIVYGDTAHPALVTQVTSPTSVVTKLHYNARGNLDTLWQSSPDSLIGLPNRRQTWAYADANTPDGPTTVKDPLSRTTTYAYTSLGLTDSVVDSRGHHTDFGYVASGSLKGMVDSVVERSVSTWRQSDSTTAARDLRTTFTYDLNGNLKTTTSPIGTITSYVADSLGRITDVYDAVGTRSGRTYDIMNRVTSTLQYTKPQGNPYGLSPLATCDGTQVWCADASGPALVTNPDSGGGSTGGGSSDTTHLLPSILTTRYFYGGVGLDTVYDPRNVARSYVYGADGMLDQEIDEFGNTEHHYFGNDGLLDSVRTRGDSSWVYHFRYDAAGRVAAAVFPNLDYGLGGPIDTVNHRAFGDSIPYAYDIANRLVTATDRHGQVRRSYFADGSVRSEASTLGYPDSLVYAYDSTGARIRLVQVDNGIGTDSLRYHYNPTSGDLDTLTAWYGGEATPYNAARIFAFAWDELGRRAQITYPAAARSMTVAYRYDALGLLRVIQSTHALHSGDSTNLLDFDVTRTVVDAVGHVLVESRKGVADSTTYNRLGWMIRQFHGAGGITNDLDQVRYDASGNIRWRRRNTHDPADSSVVNDSTFVRNDTTYPVSNLLSEVIYGDGSLPLFVYWYRFGARDYETSTVPLSTNARVYYYDGLGRLSGLLNSDSHGAVRDGASTCWYDALGRTGVPCDPNAWALAYDGDNVARARLGAASYHFVAAPGLDNPLVGFDRAGSLRRELFFVVDPEGRQYAVADSAGALSSSDAQSWVYNGWNWAGATQNSSSFGASRMESPNIPGLSFFRNRAYDQATGAWTQEDPAGIAGGLNLTQFNGNNPVTFSDPFGLCPKAYQDRDGNCPGQALVNAAYASGSSVLFNVAAAANALFETLDQVMDAGPGGLVAPEGLGTGVTGGDAATGAFGLTTKTAAREALQTMDLPEAQAGAVNRAIGRATTKTTIDLIRGDAGDVTVRLTRAGRNGYQTVESVVKADGSKTVVQTGVNAAGDVEHVDPKN
jgi:RHS repeat-associated protein